MNRLYVILILTVLSLTNSAKIFAGTLSSSGAQQDEWTVRFDLKNTENESLNDYFWIYIYDENNNYMGCVYWFDPELILSNGTYSYSSYINNFCQPTGSFTVKDGNKNVDIVLNKVRFHFSGQDGIEKGLRIDIARLGDYYSFTSINTDNSGYASVNLLPGTYTYSATQNFEVATGQFQVFPNLTQDITAEITGFRSYTFYLKTSTGEIITNAAVYVYDTDENLFEYLYPDNNGICRSYLSDNKMYNYSVYLWNTGIQTDRRSFTVNEQNDSTTVMFYPVTFKLRNPDGSKFGSNYPVFNFNNSYNYVYPVKTDENSDPVFFFPSGLYTYQFQPDSSYPGLGGSFNVDSSSVVVNYVNQTHEVKFEFKDSGGNYLPGEVRINDPYLDFSSWNLNPFSIHLPDGEYNCFLWSPSSGCGINKNIVITGKDTTIVVNHHKLTVNILDNNNEPIDYNMSISSETGNSVTVNRTGAGSYTADVLNGNYNLTVNSGIYYYSSYNGIVAIQDADTTVNIILNQFRLNVKTPDGNTVNNLNIYIQDSNYNYVYNGGGDVLLYLANGSYFYTVYSNNNYFTAADTFNINKENKEITLLAYPTTFRVTFNNQIPVIDYDLSFNNNYARPEQKDEFSSTYLLLQGEYDYKVSTKSLSGNYISNTGKVTADGSKEIPVTFYSAEFSVTLDGKPVPGSRIHLWQDDPWYYNDLYVNDDGKIRDYVSNGLYYYTVNLANDGNSYSGTFSADSQNVNINVNLYSVRFHIGQSSFDYYIYIKNTDTGEETQLGSGYRDNPIATTQLTPGHYIYGVCAGYYYDDNQILTEGEFTVDNQSVDINEYFLSHKFIISNPDNKYIYGFFIQKNNTLILYDYINGMDSLTYYLPKGEYSYECWASDTVVRGNFIVENSDDKTYILFDKGTGIQTIKDESDFRIYPNPAKDMIWFDPLVDGEISIATMDGKTVLHQTLHQQKSLNISQLRKGTYMVKINDNKSQKIIVKKLVVKY